MNNKTEDEGEDIYVRSVVFKQNGSMDEDYLTDLYISVDGQNVSDDAVFRDGDELTIAFDGEGYLLSKENDTKYEFELRGTATGEPNKTVGFIIEEEEDVVAIGGKHGFRVEVEDTETVVGTDRATAVDLTDPALDIQGADIIASFDKEDTDTATADQDDFVFGAWSLQSISTNYIMPQYYTVFHVVGDYTGTTLADYGVQDIELGGDSYTDTPSCYTDSALTTACTATSHGEARFLVKFEDIDLDAGATKLYPLTVDFKNAVNAATYAFDLNLSNDMELEDLDSDETYYRNINDASNRGYIKDLFSTTTFDTRTVTVSDGSLTVTVDAMNDDIIILANSLELTVGM